MAETITQVTQPPEFIEAESKLYLDQLRNAIGGLKGADLSQIMGPQFVAGQDPLQLQAQQAALAGIGGYQPYLQSAAASAGPTAYQQFMSPYQQEVIGTTLAEYDIQAQKGAPGCSQQQAISCRCIWWWYEKVFKEQNIYLHQIETELHYKHNYYNKDLVKLKV
jgi:hypothetical protein